MIATPPQPHTLTVSFSGLHHGRNTGTHPVSRLENWTAVPKHNQEKVDFFFLSSFVVENVIIALDTIILNMVK